MFIFKRKEKPKEKETTVPKSLRRKVIPIMYDHGTGLYNLLNRATPEQDVRKVLRILDHSPALNQPRTIMKSRYTKNTVTRRHRRKK